MRSSALFCTLILLLFMSGCATKQTQREATIIDGFAQGGSYHLVVIAPEKSTKNLRAQLDSLFEQVDRSMSLYRSDSRLSRLNANETDTLDEFIASMLTLADRLYAESEGHYDITVKPLVSAYGFVEGKPTQSPNVDSLLRFVGFDKITIEGDRLLKERPEVQLDLNSIAQGATVDYICTFLAEQGYTDFLLEVGGEIYSQGLNARGVEWVVGVDRPVEGNFLPGADLQARIALSGAGLATSGNYRKYYTDSLGRKIVHTIDALSGEPVISNLLSATVIAGSAAEADGYGTLFMILGLEESIRFLESRPELNAYLVYTDEQGAYHSYATEGMEQLILN